MKKKSKNPKIKRAKKSVLDDDEFDPKYRAVSIFLDVSGHVIDTYLELSAYYGIPYKKLMAKDLQTVAEMELELLKTKEYSGG